MEVGIHQSLVKMQTQRTEESDVIRVEVDERNKAIDVLVKALFLVCERFNRFKNTDLCMQIKSQPDIEEPDRYETKELAEAKAETKETHTGKSGVAFIEAWKKQMEKDQKLEGEICPETPEKCPQANQSGIDLVKGTEMVAPDKNKLENAAFERVGQCAEACGKHDQCKMFNYNTKTQACGLYDVTGTKKDNEDMTSGIKPDPDAPAPAPAPPPTESEEQLV